MKKLIVLTATLLASSALYADVLVQLSYSKDGQEITTKFVQLGTENSGYFEIGGTNNNQIVFNHTFKVVLKQETPNVELEVYSVTADGEALFAQPTFSENSGSITVGNDNETFTVTVKPVE